MSVRYLLSLWNYQDFFAVNTSKKKSSQPSANEGRQRALHRLASFANLPDRIVSAQFLNGEGVRQGDMHF